jgi:hypothetical protein
MCSYDHSAPDINGGYRKVDIALMKVDESAKEDGKERFRESFMVRELCLV